MELNQLPSNKSDPRYKDEVTGKTYKTASALKTAITKRTKPVAEAPVAEAPVVEVIEEIINEIFPVQIKEECAPFIPGINKLVVLKTWCKENCTSTYKTMSKDGYNWIFTSQKDADLFEKRWNTRSFRKINPEDVE